MSLKNKKDVPQLVEKYKRELPQLDRDLLRRLIRVENPNLFLNNPSNLKKLDRYLKKAFERMTIPKSSSIAKPDNSHQLTVLEQLLREDEVEDEKMMSVEDDFTLKKGHDINRKHGLLHTS